VSAENDEIILADLDDTELVQQMQDDLYDGMIPEVTEGTQILLDIHDIGKNLVGMMLEGAGFEVIDLGINTSFEEFLGAVETHNPDILGMSALLTTTMPYMGVVIEEFEKRGMLKDMPVMVGGAPLNQEFADAINADRYGRDAAISAEIAKTLLGVNR